MLPALSMDRDIDEGREALAAPADGALASQPVLLERSLRAPAL
jgi:hypothetical protein